MATSDPAILELERKIKKVHDDIEIAQRKKKVKENELEVKKRAMKSAEDEVAAIQSEIDRLIQQQHRIENDMRDMYTKLQNDLDKLPKK